MRGSNIWLMVEMNKTESLPKSCCCQCFYTLHLSRRFSHILSFSKYLLRVFHVPGMNKTAEAPALEELTGLWGRLAHQQVAIEQLWTVFQERSLENTVHQWDDTKHHLEAFFSSYLDKHFLKDFSTVFTSFWLVGEGCLFSELKEIHFIGWNCI